MISAIVAVNEDWGIGYNGDLLEYIPEDLKYFKQKVENNLLICGSKTFWGLPPRIFSQREMIIISRDWNKMTSDPSVYIPNTRNRWMDLNECKKFLTNNIRIENGLYRCDDGTDKDIFVIGGGSIYKQLLPYCDRVYVTKIYKKHENVDTYFPNLDEMNCWEQTPVGKPETYKDFSYQFWRYDRKT